MKNNSKISKGRVADLFNTSVMLTLFAGLFGFSAVAQGQGSNQALPDGQGKDLVMSVCSTCHSTATISRAAGYSSADEWLSLIHI